MDVKISDSHHLHVREFGSGSPTYLLIHGWAASGRIWDSLVTEWPADAGRLLIPDLRGTGWSSKPRDGYTLDAYTNDIVTLIDKLGLSNLILVGHSMGGAIAMRVALERPAALSKLVLVSPVPPSGVPFAEGDLAYFRSLGGSRAGAEQVLGMMMTRRPAPAIFDAVVDGTGTVAIEAFLGGLEAFRTASFADRVGAISTPTVVIGGGAEQPLNPEVLQSQVVARIPGARFTAIADVGHYPQIEAAAEFAALLRQSVL